MNRYLYAALALVAAQFFGVNDVQAQQNNEGRDIAIVMPNTANCTPPESGLGSSPDEPLELSPGEIYDLIADHLAHDETNPYECRWIRMIGHFRATNYWHYEGRIFPSLGAYYFDPQIDGARSLIIENFANSETQKITIQASDIDITGLFYDLCAAADAEARQLEDEEGITVINMGGPCHYGNLNGLMLADVRLNQHLAGPELRMRGEANRDTFGRLAIVPEGHPARPEIQNAIVDWVATVRIGEEAYLEKFEDAQWIEEMRANANDWQSVLTDPEESPFTRLSHGIDQHETDFFVERQDLSNLLTGEYRRADVYGCICLAETCNDAWPLFSGDTRYFQRDYICTRIDWREGAGWSAWH